MPAWSNVRPDREIMSEKEVENLLNLIPEDQPEIKCLVSMLYLYGCRISEALELKRENIWKDENFLFIKFRTKKKKINRPKDVKRRGKPIPEERVLNVRYVSPFTDYIISWIKNVEVGEKVFPFSYPTAYRKIVWIFGLDKTNRDKAMEEINVWLHLFRDTALTQLAYAGASPFELRDFAGWSSTDPAEAYVHKCQRNMDKLAELRAKRGWWNK
jgi:integrase